jgi:hypothetical protein
VLSNPTRFTLDVAIASGDGNPASTTYALAETTGGLFLQSDGTLGASAFYQTATAWGTTTVTGLAPTTTYTFAATARNGAGVSTVSGPTSSETTLTDSPPNALAPVPASTGPTNATSMDFAVSFDEAVQNFDDVSDLVITHSGTSDGGVLITGGPTDYTVSIIGISGNGSLTLAVSTASDVQDMTGNPLDSALTSVPVAFLHTGPSVSIGAPSPDNTRTGPVSFTVNYTGATSTSLDVSDIVVNATDTALAVVSVTGSGNTYTVTLSSITGDGTITISIAAGTAVDGAGNLAPAVGPSAVLTVDSAPRVSLNLGLPFAALMALVGVLVLRRKLAK